MSTHSVRNPFVCPSCGVNYSSAIDSDSAPCHLNNCLHTLCGVCVKKNQRVNDNSESDEPFFVNCVICNYFNDIEEEPGKSRSLMEIILECETNAKPYFVNAHIEAAELTSLKCPGCSLTYTSLVEPYHLSCGHTICQKCLEDKKVARSEGERDEGWWPYEYKCFKCNVGTLFRKFVAGGVIADVLKWLAEKKEECFQSLPRNQFVCSDCGQKAPCDHGILCTSCTKSDGGEQRVVCGFCFFKAHKLHDADQFLPVKLQSMKEESLLNIQSKIAKCNLDVNSVVDECKTLMGKFEEHFSIAIGTIPLASKCSDGTTISLELKGKSEEYEKVMEKIIPSARRHNKQLQDILRDLQESFPKLPVVNGESEEKEESGEKQATKAVEDLGKREDREEEERETKRRRLNENGTD